MSDDCDDGIVEESTGNEVEGKLVSAGCMISDGLNHACADGIVDGDEYGDDNGEEVAGLIVGCNIVGWIDGGFDDGGIVNSFQARPASQLGDGQFVVYGPSYCSS